MTMQAACVAGCMAWLAGCVAGCVAGRMTWQAVCVVGHEQQQGRLHSRLHARVGKPLQQNGGAHRHRTLRSLLR